MEIIPLLFFILRMEIPFISFSISNILRPRQSPHHPCWHYLDLTAKEMQVYKFGGTVRRNSGQQRCASLASAPSTEEQATIIRVFDPLSHICNHLFCVELCCITSSHCSLQRRPEPAPSDILAQQTDCSHSSMNLLFSILYATPCVDSAAFFDISLHLSFSSTGTGCSH